MIRRELESTLREEKANMKQYKFYATALLCFALSADILTRALSDEEFDEFVSEIEDFINVSSSNVWATNNDDYFSSEEATSVDYGTFDFIIAGGGTAGGILANRLSEQESFTVLLVEAGKARAAIVDVLGLNGYLAASEWNWAYNTTKQTTGCLDLWRDDHRPLVAGYALQTVNYFNSEGNDSIIPEVEILTIGPPLNAHAKVNTQLCQRKRATSTLRAEKANMKQYKFYATALLCFALSADILTRALSDEEFDEFVSKIEDFINVSSSNVWATNNDDYFSSEEASSVDYGTFDFIIAGGGTAGGILANRLSEQESFTVLLVEAGKARAAIVDVLGLSGYLAASEWNWAYNTTKQTTGCLGKLFT
ncbi:hypothetical protein D910_09096 [Dendroctonus ponderosae]|uniref:Glucose-methanol-choline oxidoreductase N-terminal domain-containing protein n=1 Tax=Dendroctonus ponderosae TaxID=77166 RepID=U4UP07_DENPD|nr:hypothetical protein D910_09096 [Dendroctonus ponderosae]